MRPIFLYWATNLVTNEAINFLSEYFYQENEIVEHCGDRCVINDYAVEYKPI